MKRATARELLDPAGINAAHVDQKTSSAQAEPKHDLEGVHSVSPGCVGRNRLLHRGGPHVERVGDLRRLFLYSPEEPAHLPGGGHTASRSSLDGADSLQIATSSVYPKSTRVLRSMRTSAFGVEAFPRTAPTAGRPRRAIGNGSTSRLQGIGRSQTGDGGSRRRRYSGKP
jgi:hypothetical protein